MESYSSREQNVRDIRSLQPPYSATNTQCKHGRYGHEECPACDYDDDSDVCSVCEAMFSGCACNQSQDDE